MRAIVGFVVGAAAGAAIVAGLVASRPPPPPCPTHPALEARIADLEERVGRVAPDMLPPSPR